MNSGCFCILIILLLRYGNMYLSYEKLLPPSTRTAGISRMVVPAFETGSLHER